MTLAFPGIPEILVEPTPEISIDTMIVPDITKMMQEMEADADNTLSLGYVADGIADELSASHLEYLGKQPIRIFTDLLNPQMTSAAIRIERLLAKNQPFVAFYDRELLGRYWKLKNDGVHLEIEDAVAWMSKARLFRSETAFRFLIDPKLSRLDATRNCEALAERSIMHYVNLTKPHEEVVLEHWNKRGLELE